MNILKITTDMLPDTFENVIDAIKSNEAATVIRNNLEKFEDIDKWVQMFGHNTRTHWNVRDSIPKGVQILCSKKFVCHRSRFMKVRNKNNKKGVSKNADCLSQILVQIKLNTRNTRAKDIFVKKGLRGVVTIKNIHSHTIGSAQCLRWLVGIDQVVKNKFWDYFEDGMGISRSRKHHQQIIELTRGSELDYDLASPASGKCNPTYRTVRHWCDQWKLSHLGPRTGVEDREVQMSPINTPDDLAQDPAPSTSHCFTKSENTTSPSNDLSLYDYDTEIKTEIKIEEETMLPEYLDNSDQSLEHDEESSLAKIAKLEDEVRRLSDLCAKRKQMLEQLSEIGPQIKIESQDLKQEVDLHQTQSEGNVEENSATKSSDLVKRQICKKRRFTFKKTHAPAGCLQLTLNLSSKNTYQYIKRARDFRLSVNGFSAGFRNISKTHRRQYHISETH